MVRKFLVLFSIYISFLLLSFLPNSVSNVFYHVAFADEVMKINSINFDNSDSIIFLGTSSSNDFNADKITKKTLTEPNRVYFDIENAVLTFPNSKFELKNSRLRQVKIAQNSTNPDIVRIVIWSSDNYNPSQIKVLNIKNNIIIKLGSEKPLQQYLTQVYKETNESDIEYYDKAIVTAEGKKTEEADEIFNSIQKAFSTDTDELVRPNIEQKQARLKSRFFLENAAVNNGGILLNGIGVINIEKPFILENPSRIVFDLPNTVVLQELREKEFKLSDFASAKIGQFEPTKARIVIKTNEPETFLPIYSTNLKTILITNKINTSEIYIPQVKTELTSFKERNISENTNEINIIFSNPVIYSIKKEIEKLNIIFYNLNNLDIEAFNILAKKNKTNFKFEKQDFNRYVLSLAADSSDLVDCYETLNASQLRIVITKKQTKNLPVQIQIKEQDGIEPQLPIKIKKEKKSIDFNLKPQDNQNRKKSKIMKRNEEQILIDKLNRKTIVIDPGHGGNDTGAMRNGILEKDLTLEIALKVREYLREKGLTNIIMTRITDKTLTLDDRVQIANDNDAAIYVSIHINASVKSEIKGIETHYYKDKGYELAKLMHKELINNITAVDRGLFKSKFYVINHTEAPSVLLELGFISNEQERSELVLEDRQKKSAKAIADGIIKFLTEQLNEQQ